MINTILNVVFKIKFDVQSIEEKLNYGFNSMFSKENQLINKNHEDNFLEILPIENENQLNDIENKLITYKTSKLSLVRICFMKNN